MPIVKNPHRAFEEIPVSAEAMDRPSEDFSVDFLAVIKWCARNGNVQRYYRQNFGMLPEPYGIDTSSITNEELKIKALVNHALSVVAPDKAHWQWLYEHLADVDSKMLLLNILAYRALGWKYVRMPLDSQSFWDCLATLGRLELHGQDISELGLAGPGRLRKFDLSSFDYDVKLFSEAFGVFNEFLYSQYAYRGRRELLLPQEGDCVLDCGACFGGTSLYFADRVGPEGRVISYEFFPQNIAIFNENVRLNGRLRDRITLVQKPVWIQSDVGMVIVGAGPGTQVHIDSENDDALRSAGSRVNSITIDDTVKLHSLHKVDFIKMDIEASEMMALRGSKETIRRWRPNLAISVYHQLNDFFEIPREIDDLGLGYKFYLQHSTVHGDETVIFATARHSNEAGADAGKVTERARSRVAEARRQTLETQTHAIKADHLDQATPPLAFIPRPKDELLEADLDKAFEVVERILQSTDAEFNDKGFLLRCFRRYGIPLMTAEFWNKWVPYMNQSGFGALQLDTELVDFLRILSKLGLKTGIEIGVYRGGLSYFLAAVLQRANPEYVHTLVDPWDSLLGFERFCEVLSLRKAVPGTSDDFEGQIFDLVFIDGDHTYEAAIRDFNNLGKYAAKAVGFHDIHDRTPGIGTVQAWDEIKAQLCDTWDVYELAHAVGERGLGIGLAVHPDGSKVAQLALEAAENRAVEAQNQAAEAQGQIAAAERRAMQAEQQLAAIRSSTSWNITAPLRWTVTKLRGA